MKYFLICVEYGELLYGRYATKKEAEKTAIEIGKKFILSVNENTGKIIKYRVKK